MDGPVHLFFAVDAFSGYAFNIGVEPELNAESVLKNIYLMCEIPEFREQNKGGFTLVLDEFEELKERIEAVIKPDLGTGAAVAVATPPVTSNWKPSRRMVSPGRGSSILKCWVTWVGLAKAYSPLNFTS
jgi:hypothetical protein